MPTLNEVVFKKTVADPSMGATENYPNLMTVSSTVNSLFDAVTTQQALDGRIEHRCIYIQNTSSTSSLTSGELFFQTPPTYGTFSMGLGSIVTSITTANNPAITTEDENPTGITFSVPLTGSPLSVGTIAPGSIQIVWLRRTIPASTPATPADFCKFALRW